MFTSGSCVVDSTNWDNLFTIAWSNTALPTWLAVRNPSQMAFRYFKVTYVSNKGSSGKKEIMLNNSRMHVKIVKIPLLYITKQSIYGSATDLELRFFLLSINFPSAVVAQRHKG